MPDRGDILRGMGDTEEDRELRARTQARFSMGHTSRCQREGPRPLPDGRGILRPTVGTRRCRERTLMDLGQICRPILALGLARQPEVTICIPALRATAMQA